MRSVLLAAVIAVGLAGLTGAVIELAMLGPPPFADNHPPQPLVRPALRLDEDVGPELTNYVIGDDRMPLTVSASAG